MRTIETTTQFKKDFKRELKGRFKTTITNDLPAALNMLVADKKLPAKYKDHSLTGEWKDCRDCHIRPDLVLIYSKPDDERLVLLRIGSHSELQI